MSGKPASVAFDPRQAVRFDLRKGSASDARGARLLLVPSAALEALGEEAVSSLGTEIGRACGARAAAKLGGGEGVRGASLETVVSHLAGELAVSGAFVLHVEQWGRAMVAVVSNPAVEQPAFVAAVLAGALGAASGRDIAATPIGEGAEARYFIGSPKTVERIAELTRSGKTHAEILADLQGSAS